MSSSAILATRSAVMHASLAYISPEVQAFNLLIRLHSQKRLRIGIPQSHLSLLSIPPEILLLIRYHLLPTVRARLLAETASELASYESSLRALLCPDCLEYFRDVYGSDVWEWEQFSGSCACGGTGVEKAGLVPDSQNTSLNPKQFRDVPHWLESHLSRKAGRITGATYSGSSPVIWDVVSNVLGDFGCEVLRHSGDNHDRFMSMISTHTRGKVELSKPEYRRNCVLVVPVGLAPQHLGSSEIGQRERKEDSWRRKVALGWVVRELGLSSQYETLPSVVTSSSDTRLSVPFLPTDIEINLPDHSGFKPPTYFSLMKFITAIISA